MLAIKIGLEKAIVCCRFSSTAGFRCAWRTAQVSEVEVAVDVLLTLDTAPLFRGVLILSWCKRLSFVCGDDS